MATHTQTYVLGRGKIYFDPHDTSGNTTGERYIGNTPGFSIAVESETLDHTSSDSGIAEIDEQVVLSVDRNGQIECDDISNDNLALFIIGGTAAHAQASGSVTNEALTVKEGRYYQLGVGTSNPTGVRGISSVTVTDVPGTTTYVANTDYEIDLTLGRLYIIPGGAIDDDDVIHVDYTRAANSRTQISSSSLTATTGALRYIADNPKGANRDLYAPKCNLSPSGDLQWKGDDWVKMTFDLQFTKKDTSTAQLYIDGRAA